MNPAVLKSADTRLVERAADGTRKLDERLARQCGKADRFVAAQTMISGQRDHERFVERRRCGDAVGGDRPSHDSQIDAPLLERA